jgi:DNA primase
VVANSGTALSIYQIKMLRRFTNNITLLYDGDEAGIHAAMRGTDMLLQEGMNIKVLLLPDGDDPDSFARMHSTEELKKYIDANQEDFISFKTRLTVEGITDPIKRSEAIAGIVKSISVIPDTILRSTYLSDLSSRLGLKEQTLLTTMNDFIKKSLNPSPSREGEGSDDTGGGTPANEVSTPLSLARGTGGEAVERLLMREIVRHGDEIIYEHVETDDGQFIDLNVAQYVDYDLGLDNIHFSNPLYNQMLAEAVAHSGDVGFKSESYFMNHPDIEVSKEAMQLAVDRHQLGGRFVVEPREGALRQRVLHLVMDLRMTLVSQRLKEIQLAMRQSANDMNHVMTLMQEYKETQELRDMLAKKLGNDVMK